MEAKMANIEQAFVDMYSANVMHLSQQEESRLFMYCRQENHEGEAKFYDRLGTSEMKRKEGRNSDVVYSTPDHSRRMVVLEDWYDAFLVDEEDKLRTLQSPESEYAIMMAASLGRKMDEIIIDGALGNAYGGKKGQTAVSLPSSQKIVAHDGSGLTGVGLNVKTLRAVRKLFKQNEAIKKGEKLIFAYAAQQADDLLASTEVTSSDFAAVKALVDGEVDTYMGFKFVETELLPFTEANVTYNKDTGAYGSGTGTLTAGEGRRCFAFTANRALLFSSARLLNSRVTEIPNKHYANQVYSAMSFGGTRMEEEQVVEVLCKEV